MRHTLHPFGKLVEFKVSFVLKVLPVSPVIAARHPTRVKTEEEFLLDAREGQRGAEARVEVKVPPGEYRVDLMDI